MSVGVNDEIKTDINKIVSIEGLTEEYLDLWWGMKSDFPSLAKEVSLFDKYTNERKVEKFRKTLSSEIKGMTKEQEEYENYSNKILTTLKDFESGIIGYENGCIDFFINRGYLSITEEFIKTVNEFDASMDVYEVFQAIRNVWIMNSIQILLKIEVVLTPSIFAYSMLYPYSDNYLDDINITMDDKINFNKRFKEWLIGKKVAPINQNEMHIYHLIQKIEGQYDRLTFRQVFESLIAIHAAQERSLIQQRGNCLPNERNIIGISFEKGGTSVLADGYLVKGVLSQEEASFMFGYGVFLQLIDDLQDVEEDLKNGNMTIFSQIAYKLPLDSLVNKLFWFIEKVLSKTKEFNTKDSEKLIEVIRESCNIMIVEAISKNPKVFSRGYIKRMKKHTMFRFSYYNKLKKKFSKSFSSEDIKKICKVFQEQKLQNKINNCGY